MIRRVTATIWVLSGLDACAVPQGCTDLGCAHNIWVELETAALANGDYEFNVETAEGDIRCTLAIPLEADLARCPTVETVEDTLLSLRVGWAEWPAPVDVPWRLTSEQTSEASGNSPIAWHAARYPNDPDCDPECLGGIARIVP